MKKYLTIILSILILAGCNNTTPSIEGFEGYVWKRDKFGCGKERADMADALLREREKIVGLREAEVLRLLGKADEQEIYSRNQKFLLYYLEPNRKCTAPENVEAKAKALHVRINAVGLANEIYISSR